MTSKQKILSDETCASTFIYLQQPQNPNFAIQIRTKSKLHLITGKTPHPIFQRVENKYKEKTLNASDTTLTVVSAQGPCECVNVEVLRSRTTM